MMQSNVYILIPEAIRAALMRTLFFSYISPYPQRAQLNLYLSAWQYYPSGLQSVGLH